MAERRSLTEGLKATPPPLDPQVAKRFMHGTTDKPGGDASPSPSSMTKAPISTRIRTDLAAALKRASLERQLSGTEPNTLQDILEEAIEPWLKSNGYLS